MRPTPPAPRLLPSPIKPAYAAPRVRDLGAWQAVTLINSVVISPGSVLGPQGSGNVY